MILQIVTHCWQYSRVWSYQISSLILHAPQDMLVIATVFYNKLDTPTYARLTWFVGGLSTRLRASTHGIVLDARDQEKASLWNRAIGRNIAARGSKADVVWFTDADYVFGPGCLAALQEKSEIVTEARVGTLFFPREQQINNDHATGDQYALKADRPGIFDVVADDFKPKRINRAIGGVQIVSGETARRFGYCPQDKWQQPMDPELDHFGNFHSDIEYRKQLGGPGLFLHLPNLYRIRQTHTGVVDTLKP